MIEWCVEVAIPDDAAAAHQRRFHRASHRLPSGVSAAGNEPGKEGDPTRV